MIQVKMVIKITNLDIMLMKRQFLLAITTIFFWAAISTAQAQDSVQYIPKLELGKKKKKTFTVNRRDSSLVLRIDTLIMKDKASLVFYGKKRVRLEVKHAIIPKQAYIIGTDSKNNGSDMNISIRFDELGALYVLAGGQDANNGTRTFPNGNGGDVILHYDRSGINPQQTDEDKPAYLRVDTRAGGYHVNAQTDLRNIYSQIGMGIRLGNGRLGGMPQGQVYSGSPGTDGKSTVEAMP